MESCSSHLAPPLRTRSPIRSPRRSGRRPPDPPSPLGGSVGTCCGLANGSATLPYFCCPVSSPIPLSPECTRISRRRTLVQHLRPFGMLDRRDIRYQGTKVLPSSQRKRTSSHGSARRSPVRRSRTDLLHEGYGPNRPSREAQRRGTQASRQGSRLGAGPARRPAVLSGTRL